MPKRKLFKFVKIVLRSKFFLVQKIKHHFLMQNVLLFNNKPQFLDLEIKKISMYQL